MGRFVGVVLGGLLTATMFTTTVAAVAAANETVRTMVRERVRRSSLCRGK